MPKESSGMDDIETSASSSNSTKSTEINAAKDSPRKGKMVTFDKKVYKCPKRPESPSVSTAEAGSPGEGKRSLMTFESDRRPLRFPFGVTKGDQCKSSTSSSPDHVTAQSSNSEQQMSTKRPVTKDHEPGKSKSP